MLRSFGGNSTSTTSSPYNQDQEEHPTPPPPPPPPPPPSPLPDLYYHHHHQILQQSFTSPSIYKRQLLITCADLISRSDYPAAHRLLTILSSNSSPYGDSTERLVHQFTKALSLRLTANNAASSSTTTDETLLRSSYLSLNQVTPFIRFSHLTANQAILEAIDGQESVHIIDFDIMHGLQWPPFMQAIAERYPHPTLKITTIGRDHETLIKTGDRLTKFAHSLGLHFHFHPILVNNETDIVSLDNIVTNPDETLAVNLVMYLHRLLNNPDIIHHFLRRIKSMNPRVVTLAEREGDHNQPAFVQRFAEALGHYTAVFDSLEATLPPNSAERLAVEQGWFGREITDIVAAEGGGRRERHERFRWWEVVMRGTGFRNVALSGFAVSQAKLLLRLHYPSEGYHLHAMDDSLFLGWQNQPLFSVSSWQ